MLIIFDLDDTLIDTSGTLIPKVLRRALHKMVQAGLSLTDFEEAYHMLLNLSEMAVSSQKALHEFLDIHDGLKYLSVGLEEVYEKSFLEEAVYAYENVPAILKEIAKSHHIALVSIGKEEIQKEKMKKAGIDMGLFSKIFICKEKNKKPAYQNLIREMEILPSKVFVCGDRIALDLTPAKELGCQTVHLRCGRGLGETGVKNDVDHTIFQLDELQHVLSEYEKSFS